MSEEKKVIHINPELFKISDKTRKKREPINKPKIKVKGQKPEKKHKTSTLKKNLLKMIRSHQEKRLKNNNKLEDKSSELNEEKFETKSDFEESVQFVANLKKSDDQPKPHNHTLKSRASTPPPAIINEQPVQLNYPIQPSSPVLMKASPPPLYGCLKNGSLPTFRNWKNKTQRNNYTVPVKREVQPNVPQLEYEKQLQNKIKNMSGIKQHQEMKKEQRIWKKPKKQKRIIRRSFRIGKSKAHPRISVLVSNRTLRNQANLKKIELKEKPIREVKDYLRKQGFIKVGTSTPNNVLREMYENLCMMCGEVKNYNPDNLLYNYFNTKEDEDLI